MAVEDNQPFLYYSTSETSVKNSSEEGERSVGAKCSNQVINTKIVNQISTFCQSFNIVSI